MLVKKNFDPVYLALEKVDDLANKVATEAYVKAKKYVPVLTGRLKKSIHMGTNPSPSGGNKYTVYTKEKYAKFVEYGSSTNKPRFFMRKAAADAEVVMRTSLTAISRGLK
jgi:HK97 gp10 family phage protein